MKKVYDYFVAGARITLIALDDAQDVSKVILSALKNMSRAGYFLYPGYTYAYDMKAELSKAPPQIKQSFKKYVIKAIDEP